MKKILLTTNKESNSISLQELPSYKHFSSLALSTLKIIKAKKTFLSNLISSFHSGTLNLSLNKNKIKSGFSKEIIKLKFFKKTLPNL